MKRVESELITDFLQAVKQRKISACDQGELGKAAGPYAELLNKISYGLSAILQGSDPDSVLWITRQPGKPADRFKEYLALEIRDWRLAGEKWAVVHCLANEWLVKRARPEISLARVKKIYKEYQEEIAPVTPEEAAEIDEWARSCRRF